MKPFTRSLYTALLGTALIGSALTTTVGSALAQQPQSVVTVATIGEPPTLDPVGVTSDLVSIITQHVFETLYTFDAEWKIVPLLASAQPTVSADGKTYAFPLRGGVTFHDGSPMTAEDVVASLERWTRLSPRGKTTAPMIESIKATDASTVTVTLKESFTPLLALLAMNNGAAAIVPKGQIDGAAPLKQFIGTGPYKLLEHKPDQHIRLVRFDNYTSPQGPASGYGGARAPKIGEVRFVPVPNAATRVAGMLAGQYQFADSLPAEMLGRFKNSPSVKPVIVKPFGFPLMIMNSKTGVLANQTLRQSVLAALTPGDMMLAGFGDPAFFATEGSIYSPGTPFYDAASAKPYSDNNPKKAAELRKSAGYKGEPIRIMTSTQYDFLYKMSLVAQAQLQAAGYTVDLQVLDWATLLQKRGDEKAWDAFFTYHTFVPEPSLITVLNPSYPGWWDTPEKREALAAFNREPDAAARKGKWVELQKLFYSEVPSIKVGDFYNLAAASDKLKNYTPAPWPFFWNAELSN
ncbi:peptide/nickel transport system substrate-binding protein [Azospirillum agricola]|uniref:ABC transporter substrate-binding protein n=1 Tax=Azospirillum agricola TaxID=1720247 RepID=UPI001AE8DC3F|nr:ABC transporter substrate-binding protein [Azospirillum agricola]MBP2227876.1 peptide/nickel transport system substrate-binding protein [Azospirillum agricola]